MCYYGNMDKKIINIYKKRGETPLDCINKVKNDNPNLRFLPMTYAGRLDPLAEGVLLILIGDECHKKDEYLNLSKEYEVDVLFGFSTDTYDLMGKIVEQRTPETIPTPGVGIVNNFIGKIKQSYPPYSSRTVKGKPLFMWARDGKLDEIEIPTHQVVIENIKIIEEKQISGKDLLGKIKEDIAKVKGDFRQEEIIYLWGRELLNKLEEKYPVIRLRISCGSGAYMRSIAHDIGQKIGVPALALNIVRTKVGEYVIN